MCCKGALSTPLKRSILMWSFSWHYEGMKEDALQKGLPAPDEAAVRELVLAKNVEAPDLATVKDFLRFKAAAGKGRTDDLRLAQHVCGVVFPPASPVLRTLSIVDILSIMFRVRHRQRHRAYSCGAPSCHTL